MGGGDICLLPPKLRVCSVHCLLNGAVTDASVQAVCNLVESRKENPQSFIVDTSESLLKPDVEHGFSFVFLLCAWDSPLNFHYGLPEAFNHVCGSRPLAQPVETLVRTGAAFPFFPQ